MVFEKINHRLFIIIIVFLFLKQATLLCQNTLSADNLSISLLTIGEGDQLYSTFGHSTIRVKDNSNGVDLIYNYGTFNFDTPNFYLKFIKGKLPYQLSRTTFDNLMGCTKNENRKVTENILNLTNEEKTTLVEKLEINYLPENREYYYDFFRDNCSTRLLFLVDSVIGNKYTVSKITNSNLSYRQNLKKYWKNNPWSSLGIEFLLGFNANLKITNIQSTFLPEKLQYYLRQYQCSENEKPLLSADNVLSDKLSENKKTIIFHPFYLFGLLLIISLLLKWKYQTCTRMNQLFDYLIIGVYSSLGLLLISLSIISDHDIFNWNFNLLWANPIYLLFLIPEYRKKLSIRYIALSILFVSITISIYYDYKIEIILLVLLLASRTLLPVNNITTKYSSIPD